VARLVFRRGLIRQRRIVAVRQHHDFGGASLPLATLLSGGFCLLLALMHALLGYGYARWIRAAPLGRWLGFAAWWVLWEWVRYWLLTGFPWLYIATRT